MADDNSGESSSTSRFPGIPPGADYAASPPSQYQMPPGFVDENLLPLQPSTPVSSIGVEFSATPTQILGSGGGGSEEGNQDERGNQEQHDMGGNEDGRGNQDEQSNEDEQGNQDQEDERNNQDDENDQEGNQEQEDERNDQDDGNNQEGNQDLEGNQDQEDEHNDQDDGNDCRQLVHLKEGHDSSQEVTSSHKRKKDWPGFKVFKYLKTLFQQIHQTSKRLGWKSNDGDSSKDDIIECKIPEDGGFRRFIIHNHPDHSVIYYSIIEKIRSLKEPGVLEIFKVGYLDLDADMVALESVGDIEGFLQIWRTKKITKRKGTTMMFGLVQRNLKQK